MKCVALPSLSLRRGLLPRHGRIDSRQPARIPQQCRLTRRLPLCAAGPDPEQLGKMQESLEAAMKDNPQMKERMDQMQEALKNPGVREQMQQTMAHMQSPQTRARIEALRNDPELKEKFDEIEKGGIGAMMKAMGDVKFLEKVGQAVGPPPGVQTAPPQTDGVTESAPDPAAELQMPEINTILDAAKYGDVEAVEDFLAIGKDPNLVDEFQRSPLHFAASIQHLGIIEALLAAGANLENVDTKGNSPLHYAAGYGRVEAVRKLLEAGADGSVKNDNGKTPADVAQLSDKNPILQDEELMKRLREMASV